MILSPKPDRMAVNGASQTDKRMCFMYYTTAMPFYFRGTSQLHYSKDYICAYSHGRIASGEEEVSAGLNVYLFAGLE